MVAWKKFESIRDRLSDKAIVDELIQYMSNDELADFADHLDDTCLDGSLSDELYDEEDDYNFSSYDDEDNF